MDKFAVILTGAKQYKVALNTKIKIEKIIGDYKEGDQLTFDKVLLSVDGDQVEVGTPYLKDTKVVAQIEKIAKHKTIEVIKYKAKTRYHKKNGHRQPYFEVKILSI